LSKKKEKRKEGVKTNKKKKLSFYILIISLTHLIKLDVKKLEGKKI
jgi:hypothetical protein